MCSSDLVDGEPPLPGQERLADGIGELGDGVAVRGRLVQGPKRGRPQARLRLPDQLPRGHQPDGTLAPRDRKSTRLNSSHQIISYAAFFLKKKNITHNV